MLHEVYHLILLILWAIVFSWIMGNGEFSLKLLGCCLLIIVGVSLAVGKPKDVLLQT